MVKISKKNSQVVSLFALLGSEHAKAVLRTLMKLTPGFRATNTLLNLNTFTNCYSVCTKDLDKLNLVMIKALQKVEFSEFRIPYIPNCVKIVFCKTRNYSKMYVFDL